MFFSLNHMAKVRFRNDVEIDIPEAAHRYAQRMSSVDDEEEEK